MPDSLPLKPATRVRKRGVSLRPSKIPTVASTDSEVSIACCHAAPPRDVARLLECYGTAMPRYLDIHQLRAIQASHQRWPIIAMGRAPASSRESEPCA